ncbi:MAG TPA: hypothetical protein DCP90_05405 [Clostridiales bacterium]|nr:MAG: hypothetical protein A2Y22_08800 [Clostridiales bacterium GWD2_32_59]HAN10037.1 hypothetical protein [Clostridiales bacterium]
MDNHAHMLIEVIETKLAKIMQGIQQVYTQYYNKKYKRTGHVFQQRYKAIVCNKDGYLLHLVKYIHYNPIKARLEGGVNYKWSSHISYIKGKDNIVDVENVLKVISKNKMQAIKGYLEYMKGEIDDIEEQEYKIEEAQRFKLRCSKKLINIEDLIEEVSKQEMVEVEEIVKKTKKRNISDIRKAIIILSETNCEINNISISNKLNIDATMVSKIKNRDINLTEYAVSVVETYKEILKFMPDPECFSIRK